MKNKDDIKSVELFSGTQWEASIIKSLLEDEQIEAFIFDDIMGSLFPFQTSGGAANPIRLMVSDADFDKALQIVKEFQKNRKEE